MRRPAKIKATDRIIDANINRAKEGLRVCEEIARFLLNSQRLTTEFKKIRHQINAIVKGLLPYTALLGARESLKDVGKDVYIDELKRKDFRDIFFANIQRIKESIRVLEEFSKLKNSDIAIKFKEIRYNIYALEKKVTKKISSLRYNR